jgi:hypothetical protein
LTVRGKYDIINIESERKLSPNQRKLSVDGKEKMCYNKGTKAGEKPNSRSRKERFDGEQKIWYNKS